MKKLLFGMLAALFAFSCTLKEDNGSAGKPKRENFKKETTVGKTDLYVLKNKNGIEVFMTNYGARIVALYTPDKDGNFADIALGFNTIEEYIEKDDMYLGCIVGRFANRIKEGRFMLDDNLYQLEQNEGSATTLHGGKKGFDKVLWDAVKKKNKITMTYTSPDMEQGFPGEVKATQIFTLTDDNELIMEFIAETDKPTVVNLTNHTYLNLKGEGNGDILDHYVKINASNMTPIDSNFIPTGEITPVAGTPFDFRQTTKVGAWVNVENEQLKNGLGYDHNWVLNKKSNEMSFASSVYEEATGRMLKVFTIEPGLQFYGGNFMDGTVKGKSGKPYVYRGAFIFEPQHFPDSPNHENFPSTVLRPGKKYYHKSIYKFSVE